MWNDTVIESVRRIPDPVLDLKELGLGHHDTANQEQRARTVASLIGKLKYLDTDQRERLAAALAERASTPLPDNLMLTSNQVAELSQAGIEIGAHTISHPILTSVNPDTAAIEIVGGKMQLEEILACSAPIESACDNFRSNRISRWRQDVE